MTASDVGSIRFAQLLQALYPNPCYTVEFTRAWSRALVVPALHSGARGSLSEEALPEVSPGGPKIQYGENAKEGTYTARDDDTPAEITDILGPCGDDARRVVNEHRAPTSCL